MLFNSAQFIFIFAPIVISIFFLLEKFVWRYAAISWLLAASLVFYAWDDPWRLLSLILVSIFFNYITGCALVRFRRRWILCLGVSVNLILLGYFKYANLLVELFSRITSLEIGASNIALPIGISFYTFTQIAFLVDAYRGQGSEYDPIKYGLFVTYFPHLIAGPILHHKEMIPQFETAVAAPAHRRYDVALGLALFSAGLFKKVIFADGIATFADPIFKVSAAGADVGFVPAWIAAISYALQIYFDFSGYSDMAIGLALMMGIRFPLNFNSPYQSTSLIEFWRRWHMTLSRFLRDYLYISLGGNQKGELRRYLNLFITMVLGGLWHGASLNFVIWGALHGVGLSINHLWRKFSSKYGFIVPRSVGWFITFLSVVLAWIPFRADNLASTVALWKAMLAFGTFNDFDGSLPLAALSTVALLSIAVFFPNTQRVFLRLDSKDRFIWRPDFKWALVAGAAFGVAIVASITKPTAFLYFRF